MRALRACVRVHARVAIISQFATIAHKLQPRGSGGSCWGRYESRAKGEARLVTKASKRKVKAAGTRRRSSAPGTFTPEKKKAFLEIYANGGTVEQACRKVGISWMTITNHRRSDPEFKKAFEVAQDKNTDKLEEVVHHMAYTQRNMVACFFLLKARRPHIYRDNMTVQHTASSDIVGAFTAAMGRITGSAPQ